MRLRCYAKVFELGGEFLVATEFNKVPEVRVGNPIKVFSGEDMGKVISDAEDLAKKLNGGIQKPETNESVVIMRENRERKSRVRRIRAKDLLAFLDYSSPMSR